MMMTRARQASVRGGGMAFWLGVGAVLAAALIYRQLPEIRRYLRMERM